MNRDLYKSAMSKIVVSNDFKANLVSLNKQTKDYPKSFKLKRLVHAFIALIIIVYFSSLFLLGLNNVFLKNKVDDKFVILDENSPANAAASYASVLYLDGYQYGPTGWLNYSRYNSNEINYDEIKGQKLGEVTLDLKGKRYTGIPPSFSSTHDVGTEIFSIKNIKKERAVLVVDKINKFIFFRLTKVVSNENTPFNLILSDVFNMSSNSPEVSAVDLLDENTGSWMRTSKKGSLLSLINKELPKLRLLNSKELGKNPYENYHCIPINLIFKDGAALRMLVLLKSQCAIVFGGYIELSPELCMEIKEQFEQGEENPTISELLPYKEADVKYLHFVDYIYDDKVLCENPEWSRSTLYSILDYYRVEEVNEEIQKLLVMTCTIGKTKDNSITFNFYENKDKQIIIEIKGVYYKPKKGQMVLSELNDYLSNYTEIGNNRNLFR